MNKLFTLLLGALLLTRITHAQTGDPVRTKLDLIFANLDKSQVATGRLAEAAVPLAPLQGFDGTLRDTNRTDMDVFRHLYATALSSRLYGIEDLPSLQDINQRVLAAAPTVPSGAIPIAVQCVRYAQLRPDAETAGLVRLENEQLFDVAGRTESPYQTQTLFAAAPERAYSATNTVSLVLPSSLYWASGASDFPTLLLDFGDGQGYRYTAWDQPLSTTYATGGTKRIKVKFVYSPGRYSNFFENRESWFDLEVLTPSAPVSYGPTPAALTYTYGGGPPDIIIAPTVSGAFRADYTDHLGATISIRYGDGHTQVRKPFIVVEGYNTARIAPHLVGRNNQNNTIEDFLENTRVDPAPFNYNDALHAAGYDLIYIDFREGTDDIRRNAALFEEVVRMVNNMKAQAGSTEPNVVMGQSMGGLVARYGLARLVRSGYNPQTRLLVLHDSPQRGANNPMGLQALTRQADFPVAILPGNYSAGGFIRTSDLSDKLKEALAILNAPATRQLALKTVTGINDEYEDNTFIDGPYQQVVDFADVGGTPAIFPTIVATSNGSQCGRPQNTPAYQELTRNNRDYILGPLSYLLRAGIQSRAIANALPAYGTRRTIASLTMWFTIRVLWARLDVTLLNRDYTSPANTLPYETLPGGTTNLSEQQDLAGNYSRNFIGFWRFASNTSLYNGDICFVPSYSALDVPTVNTTTAFAKYINNATDNPSPPRVARYIAQETVNGSGNPFNTTHIRFTTRNSEWIFNEMQRPFNGNTNTVGCTTECTSPNDFLISGPGTACGQVTFTTPVRGAGRTYTWTASPASLFTTAAGTGETFTTSTVGDGYGTITLQVGGDCPLTLTKSVRVGAPESPNILQLEPLDGCNNFAAAFQIVDYNPSLLAYSVTTSGGLRTFGVIRSDGTFTIKAGSTGGSIFLSASNACGTTTGQTDIVLEGCGNYAYTVSPNPAADEVQVQETGPEPTAKSGGISSVRVYDGYGRLRLERPGHGARALRLSLRELPTGLYTVHVLRGNAVVNRQRLQVAR